MSHTIFDLLYVDTNVIISPAEDSKINSIREDSESNSEVNNNEQEIARTQVESLGIALKLIPEIDGKYDNLRPFY